MASAAAASRRFRRRLVSELESRNCIVSAPVREAFLAVPREAFLAAFAAAEGLEAVYRDVAVPTKHAPDGMPTTSSSQPAIMALMLERLDLRPGQRVLEIGAGTGYNAALLRELVGPGGQVVSVELDDDVARGARHGLREAGRKARVVVGDGHEGWEPRAPYDRIVVTASSATLPIAWRDQLTDSGLLEVPLRLSDAGPHAIVTFRRAGSRLVSVSTLCGGFMPLRGIAVKPEERTSLSASAVEQGRRRQLAEVSGPGVRALSARARRRLLTLLLDGPRERRLLRNVSDAWPLALYLGLELPRRPPRRVMVDSGYRRCRAGRTQSRPHHGGVANASRSGARLPAARLRRRRSGRRAPADAQALGPSGWAGRGRSPRRGRLHAVGLAYPSTLGEQRSVAARSSSSVRRFCPSPPSRSAPARSSRRRT
jgi:protein-L-isoaspartate(D-aspartate) O-methyltransferase